MKKAWIAVAGLIAADQLVKYIVVTLWLGARVPLVPGVLVFAPIQNTHLSWLSSMANFHTPVAWMVLGQAVAAILVVLVGRYLAYLDGAGRKRAAAFTTFALAGDRLLVLRRRLVGRQLGLPAPVRLVYVRSQGLIPDHLRPHFLAAVYCFVRHA